MTHDELVRLLDGMHMGDHMSVAGALLSVIVLHRPFDSMLGEEVVVRCDGCFETVEYPCSTIKAIEKGLKRSSYSGKTWKEDGFDGSKHSW